MAMGSPLIFLVDDDDDIRGCVRLALEDDVEAHPIA